MTAQRLNECIYKGKEYYIVGNSSRLGHWDFEGWVKDYDVLGFDPFRYKIYGRYVGSTSCENGYICTYKIENDALYLDQLMICTLDEPPALFGVQPEALGEHEDFDYKYSNLNHKMIFRDTLFLSDTFYPEICLSSRVPYHKAILDSADVIELKFEWDELVEEIDHRQLPKKSCPGYSTEYVELAETLLEQIHRDIEEYNKEIEKEIEEFDEEGEDYEDPKEEEKLDVETLEGLNKLLTKRMETHGDRETEEKLEKEFFEGLDNFLATFKNRV
ncbi:MAG: hypothetical protein Q4D21_08295 [Phascolarctobacterium sp.]|nr:hypothetical protein [Phascolarctobacterium sp.]